mmetsp:Transcript_51761/g.121404  ORF Transcript_51761/g.121404 Transcript_51761/m.121404 type:complete len:255 (-) Transcript_51761:174-938(-)
MSSCSLWVAPLANVGGGRCIFPLKVETTLVTTLVAKHDPANATVMSQSYRGFPVTPRAPALVGCPLRFGLAGGSYTPCNHEIRPPQPLPLPILSATSHARRPNDCRLVRLDKFQSRLIVVVETPYVVVVYAVVPIVTVVVLAVLLNPMTHCLAHLANLAEDLHPELAQLTRSLCHALPHSTRRHDLDLFVLEYLHHPPSEVLQCHQLACIVVRKLEDDSLCKSVHELRALECVGGLHCLVHLALLRLHAVSAFH